MEGIHVPADILSVILKSTSLVQWRNDTFVAGKQSFLGALVFSLDHTFLKIFLFDLEEQYWFLKTNILI